MEANAQSSALTRDEYGALLTSRVLTDEQAQQLKELIDRAVHEKRLPAPFISGNKKEFSCLNLDVYDVQISRKRVKALVVQARSFWKHLRKGHTRSQKTYFLVVKSGRTLEVKELDNSTCAKRAKNTVALGELVGHYLGAKPVACKAPRRVPVVSGYKVVAQTEDGSLRSVYDSSEYRVGEWRVETARPQHGGGFYFYLEAEEAVEATLCNRTFNEAWTDGKALVLCAVEVGGRILSYGNGKRAASRLRVTQVLQALDDTA